MGRVLFFFWPRYFFLVARKDLSYQRIDPLLRFINSGSQRLQTWEGNPGTGPQGPNPGTKPFPFLSP